MILDRRAAILLRADRFRPPALPCFRDVDVNIKLSTLAAVILAAALAGPTARADGPGASNVNVCYLDDIYVNLRARANDAIPGVRPPQHQDKPEAAKAAEASCTGIK
jgi:hypothetical protein